MNSLPPIYLLRHGQTEWNAQHRFQGQLDSCLTLQGVKDAQQQRKLLVDIFARHPNINVYSSPLGRCRQTLELASVGSNCTPIFDDRLMEIFAGDWEGRTSSDIEKNWPELYEQCQKTLELFIYAPKGEGLEKVRSRSRSFLSELTEPSVIFTHGQIMAVMRAMILDLSHDEMLDLDFKQGCIYEIQNQKETLIV